MKHVRFAASMSFGAVAIAICFFAVGVHGVLAYLGMGFAWIADWIAPDTKR